MKISHRMEMSDNFIELFQNRRYEKHVLEIMNLSTWIFRGEYQQIIEQSNGECDYIEINTGLKYDAKIPFYPNQIEMLTSGKKHKPQIVEWIKMMNNEASEYDKVILQDGKNIDVSNLILYKIMREQIAKDKEDENIIFFFPYPVVLSVKGSVFAQFAANYLNSIYSQLCKEFDFENRSIYAIFPSNEKNVFAIRNLKSYNTEYIKYDKMSKYFEYEITSINL